jgi:hypothetical protein
MTTNAESRVTSAMKLRIDSNTNSTEELFNISLATQAIILLRSQSKYL